MNKPFIVRSVTITAFMLFSGSVFGAGKNAQVPTIVGLTLAPSASVPQFSAASARVTVSSAGQPVTSGTVKLFQARTSGRPASCANQNGNGELLTVLPATPDSNGSVTFDLKTAGLTANAGTTGLIAKFSNGGNVADASSACLDLSVSVGDGSSSLCPAGQNATISATFVDSPGFPRAGSFTWNLLITIHACKNLTNVSAQGGKSPGMGAGFGAPSTGSLTVGRVTGGAQSVTTWTVGTMSAGSTATLPMYVNANIGSKTACGTVLGLTGLWPLQSTSIEFGAQSTINTGTATVTVGPDPCN